MGIFDFVGLGRSVRALGDRVGTLRTELEALKRERDAVDYAPTSRVDLKAALRRWVGQTGADFQSELGSALNQYRMRPADLRNDDTLRRSLRLVNVAQPTEALADAAGADRLLCAVFRESVVKLLEDTIDSMEWPAEEGLPLDKRTQEVTRIDGLISEKSAELSDLLRQAEDLGINV